MWRLGERVAAAARARPELMTALGLSDAEIALAEIEPGYAVTSTAARADAFILPGSLQFAEYNGESPAGPGYSQRLSELFDGEPIMERFTREFDVRFYTPIVHLLDALLESYHDWGGTASPPRIAIVDWREVPTWSEFELLRDAFADAGRADRDRRPARSRVRRTRALRRRRAHRHGLPPRAHQRHGRAARRVPRAGGRLSRAAPSASPTACAARSRTRRRSSPILTDDRYAPCSTPPSAT